MGGAGRFPSMMAVSNFRPDIDFAVSVGTTPYRLAWSSFLIGSPARPPMPRLYPMSRDVSRRDAWSCPRWHQRTMLPSAYAGSQWVRVYTRFNEAPSQPQQRSLH